MARPAPLCCRCYRRKCRVREVACDAHSSTHAGVTAAHSCGADVRRAWAAAKGRAACGSTCCRRRHRRVRAREDQKGPFMTTSDRWYVSGPLGIGTAFDEATDPQSGNWSGVGTAVRYNQWETLNLLDGRVATA